MSHVPFTRWSHGPLKAALTLMGGCALAWALHWGWQELNVRLHAVVHAHAHELAQRWPDALRLRLRTLTPCSKVSDCPAS